jgi:hypothetical protein
MSNVIQYLEALARQPRGFDPAADAVALAALDPAARDAIGKVDYPALARLLGARDTMACLVIAPDSEDEPLTEESPEDGEDEPDARDSEAA